MAKWILEADHLHLSFGDRELLQIDHLSIGDRDRIGLIGENGMGKTTLLRVLAGELQPDEGQVHRLTPLAMIRQQGTGENGGEGEMRSLFQARGNREGLSGGEMTRNRIAEALSARPGLLLADEPTTDLDEEGLALLRKQLRAFPGAVLLVSHDRALLRSLCTRIWYLEEGKITSFPGGYDAFMAERIRQRERAAFEYDQYQAEQKRLKESAQRMAERASQVRKAPSRMGNSEARLHTREWTDSVLQLSHAKRTIQNRMEHLEVKEKPRALPEIRMRFGLTHPVEAKTVLAVQGGRLRAGDRILLQDTAMALPTGSRTALIGPNGCGKTTLLRQIAGQKDPGIAMEGNIRLNPSARIGWFDQHHEHTLNPEQSVLENVLNASVYPESFARTVMACLGMAGDQVFKRVQLLSGGEKAKTALGRLMLSDCNTLLLDEPTNHLDLFTMEELERLLGCYEGTLLFVSHDEEFVRKIATRIIRFDGRNLVTMEDPSDWIKTRDQSAMTDGGEKRIRFDAPKKEDPGRQDRQIEISVLEMRMAALSARMAAPKKGDHPDQLQEEYFRLAESVRRLKNS